VELILNTLVHYYMVATKIILLVSIIFYPFANFFASNCNMKCCEDIEYSCCNSGLESKHNCDAVSGACFEQSLPQDMSHSILDSNDFKSNYAFHLPKVCTLPLSVSDICINLNFNHLYKNTSNTTPLLC